MSTYLTSPTCSWICVHCTLYIVGFSPSCTSNLSSETPPIGENECGWEPDDIQFNCSIEFNGNTSPDLFWTKNDNSSRILGGVVSNSQNGSTKVSTSSLVLKSSSTLNGTFLVCGVGNHSTRKYQRCNSSTIILHCVWIYHLYTNIIKFSVVSYPQAGFELWKINWEGQQHSKD